MPNIVKLNNPLMGAETPFYPPSHTHKKLLLVKLNNPLVGTETLAYLGIHAPCGYFELN